MATRTYLVDVDGTVSNGDIFVTDRFETVWGNGVLGIVAEHVAAKRRASQKTAEEMVRDFAQELVWWDYPDFAAEFGLDLKPFWRDVEAWHSRRLRPYEDAVAMVRALEAKGHRVCVVSNNPVVGCLLKLAACGLTSRLDLGPFSRIFGSSNLRGQKSQEPMWRRCLAHLGLPPDSVTMVGDNPREDGDLPRSVGMQTILIDRKQSEPVIGGAGHWVVNDLRRAVDLAD